MDLGKLTVKEVLEKKLGKEATDRVLTKVNNASASGKKGDELQQVFKDALTKEGQTVTSDQSDISYGFIIP